MSVLTRQLWKATSLFRGSSSSTMTIQQQQHQVQWFRGIRVRVRNGNLEQALAVMTRIMVSSGIERLITRQPTRHIKNSEKRVLARKNLQHRIRSEDLARKLRSILIKKVRKVQSKTWLWDTSSGVVQSEQVGVHFERFGFSIGGLHCGVSLFPLKGRLSEGHEALKKII